MGILITSLTYSNNGKVKQCLQYINSGDLTVPEGATLFKQNRNISQQLFAPRNNKLLFLNILHPYFRPCFSTVSLRKQDKPAIIFFQDGCKVRQHRNEKKKLIHERTSIKGKIIKYYYFMSC